MSPLGWICADLDVDVDAFQPRLLDAQAIDATMIGAAWQRCRVHFMRNVLTKVTRGHADMVAAAIRTIFAQPTGPLVGAQVETVAAMLDPQLPAVAAMLRAAREEVTAFADFPEAHWRKVWSTNPIERLDKEVKRRTDVVGIFPNPAALQRLSACVLIEAHDEWQVADRRYLSEASMAMLTPPAPTAPGRTRAEADPSARRDDGILSDIAEQHANELHHPSGRDPGPRRTVRARRVRERRSSRDRRGLRSESFARAC